MNVKCCLLKLKYQISHYDLHNTMFKWFIFPLDHFYLMGKVKTGNPDSDTAQVIENITLKY